jgi:hypothetical protein
LRLPLKDGERSSGFQRFTEELSEYFFLVAIGYRVLFPDKRIRRDSKQFLPIGWTKRPELNQISGEVRLQFEIAHSLCSNYKVECRQ